MLILKRNVKVDDEFRFHPKSDTLEIINLRFADDLMMFSHGDVALVKPLMKFLNKFTLCLGLKPSIPKSAAFFSKVRDSIKQEINKFMAFAFGSLPMKYLGVPLISTSLHKRNCKILIERVTNRVSDWKNRSLSFADRIQLINSVLSSICTFNGLQFSSFQYQ